MANIVFDLDDTLMSTARLLVAALNSLTGQAHNHNTLYSYDLSSVYLLPTDVIQDCFRDQKSLEQVEWSGDQTVWNSHVWRWSEQGHNVVYCTARGWHPDAAAITDQHLMRVGETPCEVVIVPHGESKITALAHRGINPHVFVDDVYSHVIEAHHAGARSILFGQPWNHLNIWGNRVLSQQELVEAVDAALDARTG